MTQSTVTKLLGASIPSDVRVICTTLRDHGFQSWVVGGRVRDCLMLEHSGEELRAPRRLKMIKELGEMVDGDRVSLSRELREPASLALKLH